MKIGELAQQAGCTPDTIRFYEREGLMPPAERTQSNYRIYGEEHLARLRFIRNCRALDMTHEEVRALLRATDGHASTCGEVNDLIDAHLAHVDARIEELRQLHVQLACLREKCAAEQPVDACGIVRELAGADAIAPRRKVSHLG